MYGTALPAGATNALVTPPVAQTGDVLTPFEVFDQIFTVFLGLGTAVGVVVIAYLLYNAYKYRDGSGAGEKAYDDDRPSLGELPTGGGGGRKLFLSFTLSAIIVVSLIFWTYGMLLHVDTDPPQSDDPVEIEVTGYQFGWTFTYENGTETNTLRIPENQVVLLDVTSDDVFHTFGVPGLRVKSDAIPGETTERWLVAEDRAGETFEAQCYELCGPGHSQMTAEVEVLTQEEFREWYNSTEGSQ